MTSIHKLTLVAALLALAGCAVPSAAERARLDALIGKSELDLIRTRGVPTRTFTTDGHVFLAYSSSYTDYSPGFGGYSPFGDGPFGGFGYGGFGYGGFGYGGFGYGGFGGIPPSIDTYSCSTTFEIEQGRVASWTLRGDGC